MRTISTLCASGAGISIASIGLAIVREEPGPSVDRSRNHTPSSDLEMTAVAPYPPSPNLTSPFTLATPPQPLPPPHSHSARSGDAGLNGKTRSANAKVGQKRLLTTRASFSLGMERHVEREGDGTSRSGTPDTQPRAWLRRFSSGTPASRDSRSSPASRPGSSAISHSNMSAAPSRTESTVPMFPDRTQQTIPPNKLVKRSASLRSANGNAFSPPGSKLPLPVFRRPATSHQRSATLQEMYASSDKSDQMSLDGTSSNAHDVRPVQYFTPRVRSDPFPNRRRSSTGIPTPIRRIYADRRYTPVLVNAHKDIHRAPAEYDDSLSEDEQGAVPRLAVTPSYASSPLPQLTPQLSEGQAPRRSFSIGDLLSTGPQPLWRRPSLNRNKAPGSKLIRRNRGRVVSAPQEVMGSALSRNQDGDSERPAKRRDLTDPMAGQRSIYSSASSQQYPRSSTTQEIDLGLSGSMHDAYVKADDISSGEPTPAQTPSPFDQRRLPSAGFYSSTVRPVRVSAAQSEVTSTTVDSDSEYRSIGDASTDYQSDTVYDSYPTRTTRSSSGKRGPHIETIFDDSPPNLSSGQSTRLKDLLGDNGYYNDGHVPRYRHSTIEEEESIMSTPGRSRNGASVTSTPSGRTVQQPLFNSSPPAMPVMPDPDEIDWDAPDDESMQDRSRAQPPIATATPNGFQQSLPLRFGPALHPQQPASVDTTPSRANGAERANLFEWSEAQPSPSSNSPQRPRTVHGKKDQEGRGSRAQGRRAPSGMHARSHSVPVVPDVEGKRNNVVANKFGTWGVGSKGVTEDWNEDFDFDDIPTPIPEQVHQDEKRIDSGHEMFVPKSIREQQENVMSNIRLLREWGLLIEELKELRIRAVTLNMLNGPSASAWEEVDAMIELADQETEESTLEPRRSPPSSPGFDYNAFDEPERPNIAEAARLTEQSSGEIVASPVDTDTTPGATMDHQHTSLRESVVLRPRKDSEAVARSVIEAIQYRRSVSDPTALRSAASSKKVPFDTATLRHIVPYVKDLKRKVKDALRETENLYSSPHRRPTVTQHDRNDEDDDEGGFHEPPAFRSIFDSPRVNEFSASRRSRREEARTDHDGMEDVEMVGDQQTELARRMEDMNLPR